MTGWLTDLLSYFLSANPCPSKIEADNVDEVALETSNAIQKADDLGTVHVNLAADITTKVANVTELTPGVSVSSRLQVIDLEFMSHDVIGVIVLCKNLLL